MHTSPSKHAQRAFRNNISTLLRGCVVVTGPERTRYDMIFGEGIPSQQTGPRSQVAFALTGFRKQFVLTKSGKQLKGKQERLLI